MKRDEHAQDVTRRIPRGRIALLGLITITVYGSWFYSFGVLLDPIIEDTGWSEPFVAAAFSASSVVAGLGAVGGGWLLDGMGSRLVFAVAALVGGGGLFAAAAAGSPTAFVIAGAIGGGALGSLAFYHVTQSAAVRISPRSEDRAIAVLTIWGAFASPIFIPLTAWLETRLDWRATLRILALSAVLALFLGAIAIDSRGDRGHRPRFLDVGRSLQGDSARRLVASQALAGLGVGTILVYQVPAMTAAGLALGAASFWAGFRGFAQLGGRLPLMLLVNRLGVATTLRIAYGAIAIGSVALAFSGNQVLAAGYAVCAGFGIGAVSPLIGMMSKNVFGTVSLGTAMGFVGLVFLLTSSIGPLVAAVVAENTGSRAIPVAASAVILACAALAVRSTE